MLDGEAEEQRRSSKEAFLKITLQFLRRMNQGELADYLQSSKRIFLNILHVGYMRYLIMSQQMDEICSYMHSLG